jgi:hypothetical protein
MVVGPCVISKTKFPVSFGHIQGNMLSVNSLNIVVLKDVH